MYGCAWYLDCRDGMNLIERRKINRISCCAGVIVDIIVVERKSNGGIEITVGY